MTVTVNYYRTTAGPLVDAFRANAAEALAVKERLDAWAERWGARTYVYDSAWSGQVLGVVPGAPADPRWMPALWVQLPSGAWSPRLGRPKKPLVPEWQRLREEFDALPDVPLPSHAIRALGLDPEHVVAGSEKDGMLFARVSGFVDDPDLGSLLFVALPTSADPDEAHSALRLWTNRPEFELTQVKQWEAMREMEEINAKIEQRALAERMGVQNPLGGIIH